MPNIEEFKKFFVNEAVRFGAKPMDSPKKSFLLRDNTGPVALDDDGAYFGLILPEEEHSGPYHDFSVTVNPTPDDHKAWCVNICVGTLGFKDDYELASRPGLRRLFSGLVDDKGFCKSDFSDIETRLPREFVGRDEVQHLANTLNQYSPVLSAIQLLPDPDGDRDRERVSAFVAGYAKLRGWPTNENHRRAVRAALSKFIDEGDQDDHAEVKKLLEKRKYVVLQGAPGTGKTRLATRIGDALEAKTFFTQFHAETSYSDFIYGIRPVTDSDTLKYSNQTGVFVEAISFATKNPHTNVLLIIDEINRANLSNVLGPAFYLFEHTRESAQVELEIAPGNKIAQLPSNFHVIATMNTADRSLAVVDFALRRRFAWYTMRPKPVESEDFYTQDFLRFKEIFDWYADSNELSLQPGQGYFIAKSDDDMRDRVRYELLPLVQEYLHEGLMTTAQEEFNQFFLERINRQVFD